MVAAADRGMVAPTDRDGVRATLRGIDEVLLPNSRTSAMIKLERMTTEYIDFEDRIRLSRGGGRPSHCLRGTDEQEAMLLLSTKLLRQWLGIARNTVDAESSASACSRAGW